MDFLRDSCNHSGRENPWLGKDVPDAGRGAARFDQQAVRADGTIAIGVISSRGLGEHAPRRADQRLSRKDFLEGACQQKRPAWEGVLVARKLLIRRVSRFRQSVRANRQRLARTAVRDQGLSHKCRQGGLTVGSFWSPFGLKSEGTLRSFKKSGRQAGFLPTLRETAKRLCGRNDSGSLSLSRRVGLDHRPQRRASANYRRHVEWHRRAEAGFRLARRRTAQNRPTEEFVARQTLATRITARRSGIAEPIQ